MASSLSVKSRKLNPPLKEVYSKDGIKKEEVAAEQAMDYFVTDPKGAIYAIKPIVPELFSALLKARYSRTQLSAKQLLWREFVGGKENIPWKKIDGTLRDLNKVFNFEKAEEVAERILLQYGDDSVFELGGGHLFVDRVSQIGVKAIEDVRIGLSPLEKSTRYVVFDQKDATGDYSYYKDPKILSSKHKSLYLKIIKESFELYSKAVAALLDHYKKAQPIEFLDFPDFSKKNALTNFKELKDERSIKAANTAYNASIRAKACDLARVALPAATLTNMGVFGNARAFGYLFTKLLSSELAENQMIGEEGKREMSKILPKFFDIVDNNYGLAFQDYLRKTDLAMSKMAAKVLKGIKPDKAERVELVQMDPNLELNIAAALLYPYSNLPLRQIIKVIKKMGKKVVEEILHESLKYRTNRRHKPPRAYEIAGYELVFDITGNFGIYRDLERQRMLTQQRQYLTTELGFDMPEEFKEVGLDGELNTLMARVDKAYKTLKKDFPLESQYVTTLGNYNRWYMGMNLREAFWVTELRSVPQGHLSYRTIAQDMYLKACKVYPFLKDLKVGKDQYVDMSDRSKNLERMEAMQRIQTKLAQIEDKYS
jgi:thymidylate synthase ThyX